MNKLKSLPFEKEIVDEYVNNIKYNTSEEEKNNNLMTYISLFSGGGIGCYGFKQENFECICSVELLEKRLKFQKINNKCKYQTGYISADISKYDTKQKIYDEVKFWKDKYKIKTVDVVIATPPCQGMSLANHKKNNEIVRNSLVVESIRLIHEIMPNIFIFENVRTFLNTICTDIDNNEKTIKEAIDFNLLGKYNILSKVINFKDYGNPSSRTRTLVIGVKKDIYDVSPYDIFPDFKKEITLKESIGNLKSLDWGEIDSADIYHSFKTYDIKMLNWIKDLREGESAFDNYDETQIPHKLVENIIVHNVNKNGDKYKRQFWNKTAPCIHTRNDILSSQNTIHPKDNRVFSIREIAILMSIPSEFKFSEIDFNELNKFSFEEKRKFLQKEEMNIPLFLGVLFLILMKAYYDFRKKYI